LFYCYLVFLMLFVSYCTDLSNYWHSFYSRPI
jgi:hypothetical protein